MKRFVTAFALAVAAAALAAPAVSSASGTVRHPAKKQPQVRIHENCPFSNSSGSSADL
jgi:hypothetical protein